MNQSQTCPIHLVWEWLSSQAGCHSFTPALLGMMIGSQSTSKRWIGAQPGWLSGAAVYARVQKRFASGGAHPCVLALYARRFLWTTAHLCYSISLSISLEFPSFLNHHRRCRAELPGLQSRTAFGQTRVLNFCHQVVITTQLKVFLWKEAFVTTSQERWREVLTKICLHRYTRGDFCLQNGPMLVCTETVSHCIVQVFFFFSGWSKVMSLITCTLCCISLFLF